MFRVALCQMGQGWHWTDYYIYSSGNGNENRHLGMELVLTMVCNSRNYWTFGHCPTQRFGNCVCLQQQTMDKVQQSSHSEGAEMFVHNKILPTLKRVQFIIHEMQYVNITKRSLIDIIRWMWDSWRQIENKILIIFRAPLMPILLCQVSEIANMFEVST
jgi:hypothetical protein